MSVDLTDLLLFVGVIVVPVAAVLAVIGFARACQRIAERRIDCEHLATDSDEHLGDHVELPRGFR